MDSRWQRAAVDDGQMTIGNYQWAAVNNGQMATTGDDTALVVIAGRYQCILSWDLPQTTDGSCLSVCAGMPFDIAIRVYLDSFRLPGESQKINRIMESFGARYHMQCPELFKNPDVVYILAYSTIMLNTDQHNSQVCLCALAALGLHASSCACVCALRCECVWVRAHARACVTCNNCDHSTAWIVITQ